MHDHSIVRRLLDMPRHWEDPNGVRGIGRGAQLWGIASRHAELRRLARTRGGGESPAIASRSACRRPWRRSRRSTAPWPPEPPMSRCSSRGRRAGSARSSPRSSRNFSSPRRRWRSVSTRRRPRRDAAAAPRRSRRGRARARFACSAMRAPSRRCRSVAPDDLAVIFFTSGSTGLPKGVMIPHRALASNVRWHVAYDQIDTHDVRLGNIPIHYVSPYLFYPPLAGCRVRLLDDRETMFPGIRRRGAGSRARDDLDLGCDGAAPLDRARRTRPARSREPS